MGEIMKRHIHIVGASGSGTTTLGRELSNKHGYVHLDTDDFYWEKTDPPYTTPRELVKRQELLKEELDTHNKWVVTGSLVGWGDMFKSSFDLIVFLWIPSELRISRLHERERTKHGKRIEPGGEMHQTFIAFIDYASRYDTADTSIRSKKSHNQWIDTLTCDVLRLEGSYELDQNLNKVMSKINAIK